MDKKKQLDKVRGCLVGGAVGDTLGYPVEFISSYIGIKVRYGNQGITRFELAENGKALVSDDTQMTLFTACGLPNAKSKGREYKHSICYAYTEWLNTQMGRKRLKSPECWIYGLDELHALRAPGNTCINALSCIVAGKEPMNNSKGCGGIMRTAPVAIYGVIDNRLTIEDVVTLSADAAEITHQHPLGWLPSALEAHVIYKLLQNNNPTVDDFKAYLKEGFEALGSLYPNESESIQELKAITDKALSLVDSPASDVENIEAIGEGWVAEEAWAMAVYCTAKYFDNFEQAMIASVNHCGDSDSTGAITGNILGSVIGYDAIPQFYKDDLELHDVILHVADDLWGGETTKFERK